MNNQIRVELSDRNGDFLPLNSAIRWQLAFLACDIWYIRARMRVQGTSLIRVIQRSLCVGWVVHYSILMVATWL